MSICFAGGYWITQTSSGQDWLIGVANNALGKGDGLKFKITGLSGSLPFHFNLGLEVSDSKGIWLVAPQNEFYLDWRQLPGKVQLKALQAANVDISRFPELSKAEVPSQEVDKPLTMDDIKGMLADASQFLESPPKWMPEIQLEDVKIENALLPAGLIDPEDQGRLRIDADMRAGFAGGVVNLQTNLAARDSQGQAIALPSLAIKSAALNLESKLTPGKGYSGLESDNLLKVNIDGTSLRVEEFPPDFLGSSQHLQVGLRAGCSFPPNGFTTSVKLLGPDLQAGHISMKGEGGWTSGSKWAAGDLDGPYKYNLDLDIEPVPLDTANPDSPLNILRSPAKLDLLLEGNLPKTNITLDLKCADLQKSGHKVQDTVLAISAKDVDIPVNARELRALERENHLNLAFKSVVDAEPVDLSTELFFQALGGAPEAKSGQASADNRRDWRLGLRNLAISLLGIKGNGDIAAILAGSSLPALDGHIKLSVDEWKSIAKFVPGQNLMGQVKLDLDLASGLANSPEQALAPGGRPIAANSGATQNARLNIIIPAFALIPEKGGNVISLKNFGLNATIQDLFKKTILDCDLNLASLKAAGLEFVAKAGARGPITGPLEAHLQASGDVNARVRAQWQQGKLLLRDLEAGANLAKLTGQKGSVGIRSQKPAEIVYGENGIGVSGLDVRILPAGQLVANGGLGKDKLDFNLALENLDFKPWQQIVPQLPRGAATIRANLKGTPQKPSGGFDVVIKNLQIPQLQIPPVSAKLKGAIENRGQASALHANLALDPATLKALGGKEATVGAALPLQFGKDGIPSLNMNGPLRAKVRWNGALGPLWNLMPIADQRLNGRVNMDINAAGTPQKPTVTGGLKVEGARYENLSLGVLITDINVNLELSDKLGLAAKNSLSGLPGGMSLRMGASDGRGGKVTVNGKGNLDGKNLVISANIDRLRPLRRRDAHVELSGNARVSGNATAPVVKGEIFVNRGEILLDNLAFTGSVTTLPITIPGKKDGKKKTAQPPKSAPASSNDGSLNVKITIPPRFSVSGRGLSSIWEANMLVEGSPFNPLITGSINSVKGNFDFLGKNFALTRGMVTFAGGSVANPLLNIELTNETPDLTAHIFITGPVDKMKISLSSDPSLPRDEILSMVLFGKSVSDLSRLEALQLAGAVAQLAGFGGGGGILDFAKKALGVDVLRVGTSSTGAAGQPGDQTAGGTTIEMGKYINDIIYMGVQQGMEPDSTAFIIQLELTPRTSLELQTEQTNTWGGLKWKMNY